MKNGVVKLLRQTNITGNRDPEYISAFFDKKLRRFLIKKGLDFSDFSIQNR
jgi:hypothetical protein